MRKPQPIPWGSKITDRGQSWTKRVRTPNSEAGLPGRVVFPLGAGGSEKKLRQKHIGSAVRTGSARQQGKFLMVKDTDSAVSRDCVTLGK